MLPELRRYDLPVYVSDDSPDDETRVAVERFRADYPSISYRKNSPSLGHDANCMSTLAWPASDYVWYLGDSMLVKDGGIAKVIEGLGRNPAFLFANCNAGGLSAFAGEVGDSRAFLRKAAWYLTLTGATVYSRRALRLGSELVGDKKYRNFQQLGLIMAYASARNEAVFWIDEPILAVNRNKQSYWSKDVISVFSRDWAALLDSFPAICDPDSSEEMMKSHSKNHRLYGFANLVKFRSDGAIARSVIASYREELIRTSDAGMARFYLVSAVPRPLLGFLKAIRSRFFGPSSRKGN